MQEQIERDLKTALLGRDKTKVETLKSIKNALQYEAVNLKVRHADLTDEQIQKVLGREAKKRQEAADLYSKAGEDARAAAESAEKLVIEAYLPAQPAEEEVRAAIEAEVAALDEPSMKYMGKVIAGVRQRLGSGVDGSLVARLAKERLER